MKTKLEYGKVHTAITVVLCIILFFAISITSFVFVFRRTFSEENIYAIVSEIDVVTVIDELGVYDRIVDVIAGESKADDEATHELADTDEDETIDIEDEDENPSLWRRILADDAIRGFVANNVTGYVDALIRGERELNITREDVLRFTQRSADLISEKIDTRLEESEYEEIEKYIEQIDSFDIQDDEISEIAAIPSDIDLQFFRLPLQKYSFTVMVVFTVLLLAGIFLLNIRRIRRALLGSGIALLSSGVISVIIGFLLNSVVLELMGGSLSYYLVQSFFAPTRAIMIRVSTIIAIVGFGLLMSYVVVSSIHKNIADNVN